ncbi:hypothetical protein SAMD00019534_096140 [Acytostelium subglobosum LB1]|uniref:hypothetical protein n=1 Tax=Acytostelium subglobosum LB1 TaxID=1410327 RepID=UPI000644D17F|nr:hypothetical protein SAMD00019534_096140 [Acytostelium subglobosum LB1]GAM26439.1 hypothetical protein SAMD00019534_096140 [Acytostelium subglobosum LB1]|eukprot:XP_012750535.1 hypothetical protein SAMD00019534_096140 [Acytostelium subglobosum LB1]
MIDNNKNNGGASSSSNNIDVAVTPDRDTCNSKEEQCILFNEVYHDHGNECWPDHITSNIVLDDVSRLNATRVNAMYQVRSVEDVQRVLEWAKKTKQTVSVRGQKHSMGGHTLNPDGVVIDMQYINHMQFDRERNSVTVGTGALWSDLIQYLNLFAKAPRTLQSYSSFSIGGTLSVNGHGITTDYCLAESVIEFRLVTADGAIMRCARDAETEEARQLFSLCIGGYGLFGVIYDVVLKIKDNYRLQMDTVTTQLRDLPHVYEPMIDAMLAGEIEIKLARIDITNFELADIYMFRRHSLTPTVSNLPAKPKEMTMASKTIYKWFAGPLRELRFAMEHQLGVALDWSEVNDSNLLLFESAKPLAQLYSPWLLIDDTFILQEYFVPKENFNTWISAAKDLVVGHINKETKLSLLNITIRYVHHDTDSALPYSRAPGGSFAFVFYFRIRRTKEADDLLHSYHNKLTEITLLEGGTFYLPYRHHYSHDQLLAAYPGFTQFTQMKSKYDPDQRFSNLWWSHYGANTTPTKQVPLTVKENELHEVPALASMDDKIISKEDLDKLLDQTSIHRLGSFRALLKDPLLRHTFSDTFLVDILALGSRNELMRLMNTSVWDNRLKDDNDIYENLVRCLQSKSGPFGEIVKVWKQVKQLSDQRKELVRETVSVLSHVGLVGKVHDLVSIGDHGKLVAPLRKALRMQGDTWIVHDVQADDSDIGATLERGVINQKELGTFEQIDYMHVRKDGREFPNIPDESCDLVTMNQGLHHLPPAHIPHFLKAVNRILRTGGCLIIREHDLDDNKHLLPMLDCAHMAFNLLTGVSSVDEKREIRGFRSVIEWRQIVEHFGFRDTMVYEMQPHDPTVDIMICFRKVSPVDIASLTSPKQIVAAAPKPRKVYSDKLYTPVPPSRLNAALNQLPHLTLNLIKGVIEMLRVNIPQFQQWLARIVSTMIPKSLPGLADSAEMILKQYVNPFLTILERFDPLTEAAIPQANTSDNIVPDELFLLVHVLRARAKKGGGIFETAIIGIIDQLVGFKNEVIAEVTDVINQQPAQLPPALSLLDDAHLKEIKDEVHLLFQTMPELANLEHVVKNVGLSARATNLIGTLLPNEFDQQTLARWISEKLDVPAWVALKSAMIDVRSQKNLPTMDLIKLKGSPWNRAISTIMGAPSVQFTGYQETMAGWVGLGDVITLWRKAQKKATKRRNSTASMGTALSQEMLEHLEKISPLAKYEGKATRLDNVLYIVSASFKHYSLTKLLNSVVVDITAEANAAIDVQTASLKMADIKGYGSGFMKGASQFRMGDHKFEIVYRTMPEVKTMRMDKTLSSTIKLSHLLAKQGHFDGRHHANSDSLNHYKLPEWMQVEMVQVFGNFMEHTPWYRFPFISMLKVYFDVLFKEFGLVSQEHGVMAALSDQGFLIDLVPGIVMSVILGQMALLALPLRKMLGDTYDDSQMYESIVVLAPSSVQWQTIDERIIPIKSLDHGVHVLRVPTFKPFSEILQTIAKNAPAVTILQISNNSSLQIKLESNVEHLKVTLKALGQFEDCKINFNYNLFPTTTTTKQPAHPAQTTTGSTVTKHPEHLLPQQISVDVRVIHLLPFIRHVNTITTVKIVQIYDYYA